MAETGADPEQSARIMKQVYGISSDTRSYSEHWSRLAEIMKGENNRFKDFQIIEAVFDKKCREQGVDDCHIKIQIFNGLRQEQGRQDLTDEQSLVQEEQNA